MQHEHNRQEAVRKHGARVIISFRYEFPRIAGGRTAVPGGGAPLKVVTTGVSFDRPPVTSVRPLSVRPMLIARRGDGVVLMGIKKLPKVIPPTTVGGQCPPPAPPPPPLPQPPPNPHPKRL